MKPGFECVLTRWNPGFMRLGAGRPRKQFAMIQPSAAGRIDRGLILPGTPSGGRPEPSGSVNTLFTHPVRGTAGRDLDDELAGWLTAAYTAAG